MKSVHYPKMILFAAVTLCFLFLSGCSPDLAPQVYVRLLSETDIPLQKGAEASIRFETGPSEVLQDCRIIRFSLISRSDGFGEHVRTSTCVPGASGQYSIDVCDLENSDRYRDTAVVRMTYADAAGRVISVESAPVCLHADGTGLFALSFRKSSNPEMVLRDVSCRISRDTMSVTSPYLSGPELVASYETNGSEVYVDGVLQENGVTSNDFSEPLHYVVKDASGHSARYVVMVGWSGLPVVEIDTPGAVAIPEKTAPFLPGVSIRILGTEGLPSWSGLMEVRQRGNSSSHFPKRSYTMRLSAPIPVLGMNEHRKWVLLAQWLDRTLLRNDVSYHISRQTSLRWTPTGRHVEVVLNGVHVGNYYFCEQIRLDDDRLDLYEIPFGTVSGPDLTGGYIFEIDRPFDEPYKFRSPRRDLPYQFKDPDEVNPQQMEYVKQYISDVEDALYDPDLFKQGRHRTLMDLDSFADYWIVHELAANSEPNNPKSVYMHKDRLGALTAGPVWDFDWGTYRADKKLVLSNAIYYRPLFKDPVFRSCLKKRWAAVRPALDEVPDYVRKQAAMLDASDRMNHHLWPITKVVNQDEELSYQEAVDRLIKVYCKRVEMVGEKVNSLP